MIFVKQNRQKTVVKIGIFLKANNPETVEGKKGIIKILNGYER